MSLILLALLLLTSGIDLLYADRLQPLIDDLKSTDTDTKLKAIKALGESGDIRAVPPLLTALREERGVVRQYAVEALQNLARLLDDVYAVVKRWLQSLINKLRLEPTDDVITVEWRVAHPHIACAPSHLGIPVGVPSPESVPHCNEHSSIGGLLTRMPKKHSLAITPQQHTQSRCRVRPVLCSSDGGGAMQFGLFMMPSHPPERGLYESHQWDLDYLSLTDELGFEEAWIGEHFTSPWEPIPAPDIMIAQALMRTKRIKLGTGAHLLPFHHPAELAHRVAYLDHLAQGRFLFGIGASGLPSDWSLFNVDGNAGQHREMTREALDIILKLWEGEKPFQYQGKFWTVNYPEPMYGTLKFHIRPFQKPHPPIGVASVTPRSPTLVIAGERGFLPMSLGLNSTYIASHWEAVEEGAQKTGKHPSRRDWRIVRDVYVAETDAQARDEALNGMLGRVWGEYLLPLFGAFQLHSVFKHDADIPDSEVTPAYLMDHLWLVGSPETVVKKIEQLYEASGGFGTLLMLVYDHCQQQAGWERSTRLLATEVLPKIAGLVPA